MLALYVNTLLNQGLFWQKLPSPHTSRSKAVRFRKGTGFICNREPCAKYTFVLIQGENELIPCSEVCITGLLLAGCFARCMRCCKCGWILLSDLHFSTRDLQTASMLVTCVQLLFYLQSHMLFFFFSVKDGKRDWNESPSVGLTPSSVCVWANFGLDAA